MKKIVFAFLIAYAMIGMTACTTQRIVTEEPVAVAEVQGPPPGPSYVWVNSEYTWQSGRYVVIPGRWVVVPRNGAHWVPGHWNHVPRGYVWVRGHWN